MRTFERFPNDSMCPICGTNDDKVCVLVAIAGTQEDNIVEAIPTHLDCINLTYYDDISGEASMLLQIIISKRRNKTWVKV